jgi:aldose 1-epimerase
MITKSAFGMTGTGEAVSAYRLTNSRGASAVLLDYGCTVQSLCVPDKTGVLTDVVLGFETVGEYEAHDAYLGALIGRFANRIGGAEFTLNGKRYELAKNDGENHLHGGLRGFDKFVWNTEIAGDALVFRRLSPDGEENYPGNLSLRVTYTLTEDNALTIVYEAETDADTLVNLTNHSYFRLGGADVLGHELQVFADAFTENDVSCLPTGRILPVAGTAFDFRTPKAIGRDIGADDEQLRRGRGYDHNFVLSDTAALKRAAVLTCAESGIRMKVFTTLPGMQVYSANMLGARQGKPGQPLFPRGAVCLETQMFPNAPALPHFPSAVLKKGEHYHTITVYAFETSV